MSLKDGRALKLTPRARDDLYDIWLYGAETWGQQQADTYFNSLFDALEGLSMEPGKGRARPELFRHCYSYVVGSHVIYYRLTPCDVEVLGILHQRMDVSFQLTWFIDE